jgi:hypothetical protein
MRECDISTHLSPTKNLQVMHCQSAFLEANANQHGPLPNITNEKRYRHNDTTPQTTAKYQIQLRIGVTTSIELQWNYSVKYLT